MECKSYFLDKLEIKGKLTGLPKTVTASLEGDQTWTFIFSAASHLSTLTPLVVLAAAFVWLA